MRRTITVTQDSVLSSTLSLAEAGVDQGTFRFRGFLKRSAQLELGSERLTFTTLGPFGRTVRADHDGRGAVGEFRQTGIIGRGHAEVGGRRYRLSTGWVLGRRFSWVDAGGTEAMCLRLGGILLTNGTIEVSDAAVLDDVAVLIGLGLVARRAAQSDGGGGG